MAIFSTAKKTDTAPLTLRDVAPEWVRISDKVASLCKREDELHAEMRPIQERVKRRRHAADYTPSSRNRKRAPEIIAASKEAAEILGELTPEPRTLPVFEQPVSQDVSRLGKLTDELNAVREALSLLRDVQKGERRSRLEKAHLDGSLKYCEAIEPEYRAVADAYISALVALGRATADHDRFLKDRLSGVAYARLRPVQTSTGLGDPRDPSSEIRRLLTWAAECGRFDLKNFPDDWKGSPK
jgi:hypothetical protein